MSKWNLGLYYNKTDSSMPTRVHIKATTKGLGYYQHFMDKTLNLEVFETWQEALSRQSELRAKQSFITGHESAKEKADRMGINCRLIIAGMG